MAQSQDPDPQEADQDLTGLPFFRSWPAVYAFVLGTFAVYVVLLTLLSRAFR